MGRKLGGCALLGEGAASQSNTMLPWLRPICVPSFILIHPTVWPQYTNVTDRTGQDIQDRQGSDSIGRTVLQMVAQKRCDVFDSCWKITFRSSFLRSILSVFLPHANQVLFLTPSVTYFVLFVASNSSETAVRICAKFTRKTCLVPRSDEFECQGQRSKIKVTRDKTGKTAESSP